MPVAIDMNLKNVKNRKTVEKLIQEKVEKLEKICRTITHCRVVVEHPSEGQKKTNRDHIHIEIKFPPHHDILVKREALHDENLTTLVREAFVVVRRQVQDVVDKHQLHKGQRVGGIDLQPAEEVAVE